MVSEEVLDDLRSGKKSALNLSFAGCGFLGIYHVGVASCLKENAPHLISGKISGASAGGLVASAMITDRCLGECTAFTLELALKARSRALGPLHPSFGLVHYLEVGLRRFLPSDAHLTATGRLHISLTRVSDRRNVLVSQYDSKEDLIQALICSAFVPFYCGLIPPKYKGVRYIDGGLSDNIPILDDNTISVSPFSGESDICPNDGSASFMHLHLAGTSIQCNTGNLFRFSHAFFPPEPEVLSQMCRRGYDDALRFLQANNLISCPVHVDVVGILGIEEYETNEPSSSEACSTISDADYMLLQEYEDLQEEELHQCLECPECRHQLNMALGNSLPPSVTSALQSACDEVNTGVLNNVYKLRAFKVLSLMAAPYLLPWECAVLLTKRFWSWAPYMHKDFQWFYHELHYIIRTVLEVIQKGRHKYSARFSWQLALTELQDDPEYNAAECSELLESVCSHQHGDHQSNTQRQFGFSFAYNPPPKLEHRLVVDGIDGARVSAVDEQLGMARDPLQIRLVETTQRRHSTCSVTLPVEYPDVDPVNNAYDSFEHGLSVAQQMDSMLSVHYESKENLVTVEMASAF